MLWSKTCTWGLNRTDACKMNPSAIYCHQKSHHHFTLFFPRAILIFSGNFSWVLFSYNSILKSGILTKGSTGYCSAQPLGWRIYATVMPQGQWCDLQWPQKVFGHFWKSNLKSMNFITCLVFKQHLWYKWNTMATVFLPVRDGILLWAELTERQFLSVFPSVLA